MTDDDKYADAGVLAVTITDAVVEQYGGMPHDADVIARAVIDAGWVLVAPGLVPGATYDADRAVRAATTADWDPSWLPTEADRCPDCATGAFHTSTCVRSNTCAQIGPPWLGTDDVWHTDADYLGGGSFTAGVWAQHMADKHPGHLR